MAWCSTLLSGGSVKQLYFDQRGPSVESWELHVTVPVSASYMLTDALLASGLGSNGPAVSVGKPSLLITIHQLTSTPAF